MASRLCLFCGVNRADWYLQHDDNGAPQFVGRVWEWRSALQIPICDDCKTRIERAEAQQDDINIRGATHDL